MKKVVMMMAIMICFMTINAQNECGNYSDTIYLNTGKIVDCKIINSYDVTNYNDSDYQYRLIVKYKKPINSQTEVKSNIDGSDISSISICQNGVMQNFKINDEPTRTIAKIDNSNKSVVVNTDNCMYKIEQLNDRIDNIEGNLVAFHNVYKQGFTSTLIGFGLSTIGTILILSSNEKPIRIIGIGMGGLGVIFGFAGEMTMIGSHKLLTLCIHATF